MKYIIYYSTAQHNVLITVSVIIVLIVISNFYIMPCYTIPMTCNSIGVMFNIVQDSVHCTLYRSCTSVE